ncbi:hypothetical protein GJ496_004853 [Pomphorhynchus laevis]|nr:hypothetical protein GJ496_004853 [Pomphorhynchus laevis]
MDKTLNGVESVTSYLDNVVIATETEIQNLRIFDKVFQVFKKANISICANKCEFLKTRIRYLCVELSNNTIVQVAKRSKDKQELKSFCMIAYHSRFVPRLQELCKPIYELTKINFFNWKRIHDWAYDQVKCSLQNFEGLVP